MKTTFLTLIGIITLSLGTFSQSVTSATIDVTVLNFEGIPYSGDKVYFVGQQNHKSLSGITNSKGKFRINLPQGEIYDIKIKSIGDELEYNTLEIPQLEEGQYFDTLELTISYEAPKSYTLNSLNFETGKATIKQESYVLLDDIVELMKLKPDMKILIEGHTDSDGEDTANLILSDQRAKAVKAYLISKGINSNRISSIGYGETRPLADNSSAEGKAKNRRTEVRIL